MKIPFDVKDVNKWGIPFRAGERQCFIEAVKGWSGYCTAVGCNEK